MNSKRMFYVMIAVLVLTVVGTGVVYYFAVVNLSKTLVSVDEKEAEFSALSEEVQSFAVSKAEYTLLRSKLGDINQVLPPVKDQSVVIEQLKYIGRSSNMSITGFSFQGGQGGEAGPSAFSLTQSSEIAGASYLATTIAQDDVAYVDFVSFLNNVNNFRRPYRVTSIQVTPLDAKAERVSFSVDVEAFIVTPPGAPAGPVVPGAPPAAPPTNTSKDKNG